MKKMSHALVRTYCINAMREAGIKLHNVFETCLELDELLEKRNAQQDEELMESSEEFLDDHFEEYLKVWVRKNPDSVIWRERK